MILKDDQMIKVTGGAWSGAIITALYNVLKGVYKLGTALGSAIRRTVTRSYC